MTPRERVLEFISGRVLGPPPVLPQYLGLYRHRYCAAFLREAYRERVGEGRTVAVDFDTHLALLLEAEERTDALFEPLPDWVEVGLGLTHVDCFGARARVDGDDLWWFPPGSSRPANLTRPEPCVGRWETGIDTLDLAALNEAVPIPEPCELLASGAFELARQRIARHGGERTIVFSGLAAPFWSTFGVVGFAGLMGLLAAGDWVTVRYMMERSVRRSLAYAWAAKQIGADIVFIEECLASSDVISEADFQRYPLPYEHRLVGDIQRLGLPAVLYFCGGIEERLRHLKYVGANVLSFEESKKGFTIDLARVRQELGPRQALLGNLDVRLLEEGANGRLERELAWQREAAGTGAFAHSNGSPLTPGTLPEHVGGWVRLARLVG
ncbi:MAG TPA: uroporphyrinogen decarboxylase family protein [Armatimonadota bacterium]|nr:uroporphyrinogen decarboxylase family protein [Armatimonadota bacterium]